MEKTPIYKTSSGYDTTCDTNTGITSSPLVEDYDANKHEIARCEPPLNNVDNQDIIGGGRRRKSKKSKKAKKTKKSKKAKKAKKTKKSRKH